MLAKIYTFNFPFKLEIKDWHINKMILLYCVYFSFRSCGRNIFSNSFVQPSPNMLIIQIGPSPLLNHAKTLNCTPLDGSFSCRHLHAMPHQVVLFQAQDGSWLFLAHTAIATVRHSPIQRHCRAGAMNQRVQPKDLMICLPSLHTGTPDPKKCTHAHTEFAI